VRLERTTVGFQIVAIALVAVVAGQSQAMRVAWIEDSLSLLPPLAFLLAARRSRRAPDRDHPYGHHRSIGVAHLVAGVALAAMGAFLAIDSASTLIRGERPAVGLVVLFGHAFWAGWSMVGAMVLTSVPAVILGRLKMRPAEELHDKVLYADADMGKANWTSGLATVIGVLGIGIGWWWADSAAALLVSLSILKDGVTNVRGAMLGLTDVEARTFDDREVHPLVGRLEDIASAQDWTREAVVRVRDEGHVFHVECFVVPSDPADPSAPIIDRTAALRDQLRAQDWKVHDVVVVPVARLPKDQTFPADRRSST
jgi:divalent metal cation (Fe/Co/Zn/Cd) transporter